jgi:hypothetical protein
MAIKFANIFNCETLQNLPKMGFLVWKYTTWQPWFWNEFLSLCTGNIHAWLTLAHSALAQSFCPAPLVMSPPMCLAKVWWWHWHRANSDPDVFGSTPLAPDQNIRGVCYQRIFLYRWSFKGCAYIQLGPECTKKFDAFSQYLKIGNKFVVYRSCKCLKSRRKSNVCLAWRP